MCQRYFQTIGSADAHIFEIADGVALLGGITDHDFDVVPFSLHALGFFAVETLSDLTCHVDLTEAQRFRRLLGSDLDLQFSLLV